MKLNGLLVLLFLFIISSCKMGFNEFFWRRSDVSSRSTHITDISPPETIVSKQSYNVLLLADIHYSEVTVNPEAVLFEWLDSLEEDTLPDFCIVLGDMTNYGFENEYEMYDSLVTRLNLYNIPVLGLLGNHDIYNSGWDYWIKYVEPQTAYYRFSTPKYSWYFLDSANGTLGEEQFNNLIEELQNDKKQKLIFSHYPLYRDGIFYFTLLDSRERAKLIAAFADNDVLYYFAGHKHSGGFFDYGSFIEVGVKAFVNTKIEGYFNDNGYWAILSVDENTGVFSYDEYWAQDLSVSSIF